MLKSNVDDQIWLVPQHQHALVSGYLAAHWGGVNGFSQPGQVAGAASPAQLRDEAVLGIAEHDNGWWEWEAMPRINGQDGLPVGLGEVAEPSPANDFDEWRAGGFERWRMGVERLAPGHPYAALLASLHAYWLYAVAFDDLMQPGDDALRHFVFGEADVAANLVKDTTAVRQFLVEQSQLQEQLKASVHRDPRMAGSTEPEVLRMHLRLLQLLDSLSLFMALNDPKDYDLPEVPRGSWEDRITLSWRRVEPMAFTLDPYPFDLDPLPVTMPVRIASASANWADQASPLTRLHSLPMEVLRFEFRSR